MTRREFMLAAMATGQGASFTPVQVQKLFFLIDREAAELVGGPYFDFQPYHYGPFDKSVYKELERLQQDGLVEVGSRSYTLSARGQAEGETLLTLVQKNGRDYLCKVSAFVRRLSFSALVSAIYKEYPEMRKNSVFQG